MANDPAFLFYSKDWLQGTAQMSHEEKGVYVDLLCHQHQDDGLPNDTKRLSRMAHLSEPDFLKIWEFLSLKFEEKDGKLFNKKLVSVIKGRSDHGEMRRIIGTFGRLLKDSEYTELQKKEIRKLFKYNDFLNIDQQNLSKEVSKWLANTLPIAPPKTPANIGNETEDGNGNGYRKGGMGEKMLCPEMVKIFKESYPLYPDDEGRDYPNCYEIAKKIAKTKKWSQESITNGRYDDTLLAWRAIVIFSKSDSWYSTRSIQDFNNEFQRLIQKILNGTDNRRSASEKPIPSGNVAPGGFGKL